MYGPVYMKTWRVDRGTALGGSIRTAPPPAPSVGVYRCPRYASRVKRGQQGTCPKELIVLRTTRNSRTPESGGGSTYLSGFFGRGFAGKVSDSAEGQVQLELDNMQIPVAGA